jgi:hypothetical protein
LMLPLSPRWISGFPSSPWRTYPWVLVPVGLAGFFPALSGRLCCPTEQPLMFQSGQKRLCLLVFPLSSLCG